MTFTPLLGLLAVVVGLAPATIDHWLARWIKSALALFVVTAVVGLACGSAADGLQRVAAGADWHSTGMLELYGFAAGALTALINVLKGGSTSGGGSTAGSGSGDAPTAAPTGGPSLQRRTLAGLIARAVIALAAPLALAVALSACPQPQTPANVRAEARAAVLVAADGVAAGYNVCADAASALPDQAAKDALKAKCAAVLDPASDSLKAAAQAVDTWDDAAQGEVGCAVQRGLDALQAIVVVVSDFHVTIPPEVEDGIAFARAFAPSCSIDAGAGG